MSEKHKKWGEAVMIPLDKLVLSSWNVNVMDDAEFAALCQDIKKHGFDEPCQVTPIKDTDTYLVIGGEHRYKALNAQNAKEVPCVIKESLTDVEEKELMLYSVRRNNLRGRLHAQKYAQLEHHLAGTWSVATLAARREMLIKGDLLKTLRKSPELEDNESIELSNDDSDNLISAGETSDIKSDSDDRRSTNHSRTGSETDANKKFADRRALLMALKAVEQEVLLESADTVEFGYLCFGQGSGTHLVVNESRRLFELVAKLVETLKRNSDRVDEFLCQAIEKELPGWE